MEAGAGNTSHPGPGPIGPVPGPWSVLNVADVGVAASRRNCDWIGPSTALRGVRKRGEFCANAVRLIAAAIAAATGNAGILTCMEYLLTANVWDLN